MMPSGCVCSSGIAMATPAFFIALLVLLAWVLVASILIYLRSGSATAAPVPALAEP